MKFMLITGVALLCTCLPAPSQATDQDRPVLDVIIVDVNGDVEGFLERMKRLQGVAKRLNLPATLRVFQGTFAAEKNGEIHLYWELPSFIVTASSPAASRSTSRAAAARGARARA